VNRSNRKHFLVAVLFALALLTVALSPLSAQLSGSYDSWLDFNGDGIIDANDLQPLGQAYGASGDPTRNVNVTNWPVDRPLFAGNLVLRATRYGAAATIRELVDATTTPSNWYYTRTSDSVSATLNTTQTGIYNQTFIYERIPTDSYQVLGIPKVMLTFNLTNSPSASLLLSFVAWLGKISMSGTWTQVAWLGSENFGQIGALNSYFAGVNIRLTNPVNATINAYERLAIRITVQGRTVSGTTNLDLWIRFSPTTDEFVVDIPIAQNP